MDQSQVLQSMFVFLHYYSAYLLVTVCSCEGDNNRDGLKTPIAHTLD